MANISREDVIRRMCILLTKVGNIQFKDQYGHDCFCADEHKHSGSFIFDEEVVQFVESTIEEKLVGNVSRPNEYGSHSGDSPTMENGGLGEGPKE